MIETIRAMARKHFWKLEIQKKESPRLVSPMIDNRDWRIRFVLDPEAETRLAEMGIDQSMQRVLAAGLVRHEMGHWEICPFDSDGKFLIINEICRVEKKYRPFDNLRGTKQAIQFLSNLVSDIIVDTVQAHETPNSEYADCQALFFLKEFMLDEMKTGGLYDQFTRLNLLLWGNRSRYAGMVREKLDESQETIVQNLAERIFPCLEKPAVLTKWLKNRRNWPIIARNLADYFITRIPVDGIEWWGPSPFREILTVLYEGRTRSIRIKAESDNGMLQQWPVSPLMVKPVDPLYGPDPSRLDWHQTTCAPVSLNKFRLQFQQIELSINETAPMAERRGYIPDLAFIVDSSLSMSFDPYKGTGEYDLLLRTIFGVFHWLRQQKIAFYMRYAAVNFSNETEYSGWHDWNGRERIYQTLFNYQGGGTFLGCRSILRLMSESRRSFMAIMITDGFMDNDVEVGDTVIEQFSPPGGFVLVEIGGETSFSLRLKKNGFITHAIQDVNDLNGLVMGEVRRRYGV